MSRIPLSQRKRFAEALVLSTNSMGGVAPSIPCEIALRRTRRTTEIWVWNEELGAEKVESLARGASHRDVVDAMVGNEAISASIWLDEMSFTNDEPPMAELLALAWSDDEANQRYARILCMVPWDVLAYAATKRRKFLDADALSRLDEINDVLNGEFLDPDDLEGATYPLKPSASKIWAALLRKAGEAAEESKIAESRAAEERKLLEIRRQPFKEELDRIYRNYSHVEQPRRYPGGGSLPPRGMNQLRRYTEGYWEKRGKLPDGLHTIPSGPDIFQILGVEFVVNFDQLRKDVQLVLQCQWLKDEKGAAKAQWRWKNLESGDTSEPYASRQDAVEAWICQRIALPASPNRKPKNA